MKTADSIPTVPAAPPPTRPAAPRNGGASAKIPASNRVALAVAMVLGLLLLAPSNAAAEPYWSPVYSSCSSSTFPRIEFTGVSGTVWVGYGHTHAQSTGGSYVTLSEGTSYLHLGSILGGVHDGWWQVWNSPGDINGSWSLSCVPWAR